jgi:PAS domain S-box-containing protein
VDSEVDGMPHGVAMASKASLAAEELAAVLEQLPSGVVVVDQQGRPLLTNHAARELLGGLSSGSRSLIDPPVAAELREADSGRRASHDSTPLARALRGELVTGEEYFMAHAEDAEAVRLRVSGIPLRTTSGAITGAVSVFTDITAEVSHAKRVARLFEVEQRARSQTEQAMAQLEQELAERRRAEEALHSSQQRLRLALEASHMGTWDYDVVQDHVEWSPEMASITGGPHDSSSSSLLDGLGSVHPDDHASVERAIRDAIEFGSDLQVETRIVVGPAKRVRWLLAKGRVYRDEQGRPLRMTGIAMDITERKEAEAARHSMAHGERLRALGEMASGIAHDLNQSLALITGYSDMVRQELNLGVPEVGRVRDMIDITARAALEGGKALRGLLSFVRTQELMTEIERVDVGEVLHDVARLTAPRWRDNSQAEGRPIHLEVKAEPGCWVNGSTAELRESITNLIFNAVDALPRGGAIYLRADRQGEHVVVEVSDTGTGIPREVQGRVFDPFFTTKGEHGTGLGLPQVLAIVEKHGGSVELDSAIDRGTTIRMRFPRASPPASRPVAAAERAEATEHRSEQVATPARRGIRVLVVEDEEQLARMARIVLSQQGHQVTVAASGEEALARLDAERFELIISDLGLGPGKNGWDLAQETREHWPDTRFVLVTGWGAAIDPADAKARGVDEVIAKPYRIADLRQVADHVADTVSNG